MTNLFHVKPAGLSQCRSATWVCICCSIWLLAAQVAWADVHKCTAPDGRVTFSDQPCAAGQVGGKTRFGTVAPTTTPPSAVVQDASALSREDTRTRMHAALTPECRELSDRVTRYMEQGTGQTPEAVVKADMARFEQQCAAQVKDVMQVEMDRKAAERKTLEAQHACQEKRRVLENRRARFTSLSEPDQRAVESLESEVNRDCH